MMSSVYISKALRKDIPSDAVLMTKDEVLERHWDTVRNWKPVLDIWPFRYGIGLLAGLNSVTALSIVNYYRTKLKLEKYGKITMVLPVVLIPTVVSTMLHVYYVTNNIFLNEECPLCLQTRAAAIQVGVGTLFPLVTSPLAGFYYALIYGTFRIPPFTLQNIPEILKLYVYTTKNLRMRFPVAVFSNAIAASALTYFEAKSFYHVQSVLYEREEQFRNASKRKDAL